MMYQCKILHGIHNTKTNPAIWKIKQNSLCEKCDERVPENTPHYFQSCTYNKNLLKEINRKAGNILEINIEISELEYITGIWTIDNDTNLYVLDLLIFLGRMFIITQRRKDKVIDMVKFTDFLLKYFEIDDTLKSTRQSRIFQSIAWDRIISNLKNDH